MNLLVTPASVSAAWQCVPGATPTAYAARVMINTYGGHVSAAEARELAAALIAAAEQAETFAVEMAKAPPADRALFETPMKGLA